MISSTRLRSRPSFPALAAASAVLAALAGPAAPALADPLYAMTVLGGLGSQANGINNLGDVVGDYASGGATHGFVYTSGGFADLGTLGGANSSAAGINDRGQIVGSADTGSGQSHAFLYGSGGMADLGTLGGAGSAAYAINNAGVVVGTAMNAQQTGLYYANAFSYAGGAMHDLGTLNGGLGSIAYTVNNPGLIAGRSYSGPETVPEYPYYAVTFQGGAVRQLPNVDDFGIAYGSNDAGQLVGRMGFRPNTQAFLYTDGQVRNLGTLDPLIDSNQANDINNLGHVVGSSEVQIADALYDIHGFLVVGNGAMVDLNSLIDPGSGLYIQSASAINDSDQIAATACRTYGECYAVRLDPLSPIPEPGAWAMLGAGAGLFGLVGLRRRRRAAG